MAASPCLGSSWLHSLFCFPTSQSELILHNRHRWRSLVGNDKKKRRKKIHGNAKSTDIRHISSWLFNPSRMQGIQMEIKQLEVFSWDGQLLAPQLLWEVGQAWDGSLSTWDDPSMGNSNSFLRDQSLNPSSPADSSSFPPWNVFVSSNKLKSMDGVKHGMVILEILLEQLGHF